MVRDNSWPNPALQTIVSVYRKYAQVNSSYAAATSGQVNSRLLASPLASLLVGSISGCRSHAPSHFINIGIVVALPDRARVVVVTDVKTPPGSRPQVILFLTGIRA